jgi:hypothetical protein
LRVDGCWELRVDGCWELMGFRVAENGSGFQGFQASGEAEGVRVAVLAEEAGGFVAAEADAAKGQDGAGAGQGGEL